MIYIQEQRLKDFCYFSYKIKYGYCGDDFDKIQLMFKVCQEWFRFYFEK